MSINSVEKIFDGLSTKLQSEFDFLSSQITHSPTKGAAREFVLKELLRQHLPKRLGIGSGIIFATDGAISKQMDIVIYDSMNTPIMYAAGDIQIFPVECVYAVIEVKSNLNSNELKASVANIRSVKSMPKVAYVPQQSPIISTTNLYGEEMDHFPVLGFLFAYSSIKNIKIIKDKLVESDDSVNLTKNLDSICILNRAIVTNYDPNGRLTFSTKEPNTTRVFIQTPKSLLYFYLQLTHALPQATMRPVQMTKYAQHVVYGKIEV